MSSRDLVIETLKFNKPQRIPRQLWTLPWAKENYPHELKKIKNTFADDIVYVPGFYQDEPPTRGEKFKKGEYVDEWGCIRKNLQDGIVGEIKEPLVETWNDTDKIYFPEERFSIDIEKINQFCLDTDKFTLPEVKQRPFERLQFLRKPENLYMDLIKHPEELKDLLERIHAFYLKEIELWCKTEVDGIFLMDDWGAQNSLLISPRRWKSIFKPLYKEYIDLAHANGKYVFMHSDGHIMAIIPDLIEIGLDAINSQLFCMDIEEIGEQFAGQITFWGEIDRQQLLVNGSVNDIKTAVKKLYKNLYCEGGVIAQCEFGPGAKPENIYQVFKTWNDLLEK